MKKPLTIQCCTPVGFISQNCVLYRPSNDAIKRKQNPQTDTFRSLIDLIFYFPLSRSEFSNFDQLLAKFYGRTFIWRKENFKIYDEEHQTKKIQTEQTAKKKKKKKKNTKPTIQKGSHMK